MALAFGLWQEYNDFLQELEAQGLIEIREEPSTGPMVADIGKSYSCNRIEEQHSPILIASSLMMLVPFSKTDLCFFQPLDLYPNCHEMGRKGLLGPSLSAKTSECQSVTGDRRSATGGDRRESGPCSRHCWLFWDRSIPKEEPKESLFLFLHSSFDLENRDIPSVQ